MPRHGAHAVAQLGAMDEWMDVYRWLMIVEVHMSKQREVMRVATYTSTRGTQTALVIGSGMGTEGIDEWTDVYRLYPSYRVVAYVTKPNVVKFAFLLNFYIPSNAIR